MVSPHQPRADREHHRLRHRLEQLALDPTQTEHGDVDERDDRDPEQRRARDHPRGLRDRPPPFLGIERFALRRAAFGEQAQAVLDHHDRPIDDQPEVERAQTHQIARHSDRVHPADGDEERERDDDRDDQCGAPIPHHEQQHERDEQRALAQIVLDGRDRAIDQVGAAVLLVDHHALGQCRLDVEQRLLGAQRDLAAVLPDEHHDRAKHRFAPVLRRRALPRRRSDHDVGEIADLERQDAGGELDRDRPDLRRVHDARVGAHRQPARPLRDDAAARILDVLRHRLRQFARGDAVHRQPDGIRLDDELLLEPAVRVDVGDPRHGAQHRADGIFLRLVQLHQLSLRIEPGRRAAPFERVVEYLAEPGRDRRELRGRPARQLIAHRAQPLGHELARAQLLGAVLVEERDLAEPRLGQRARLVEPGLPRHRALDRQRHQPLDLLGRECRHRGVDLHLHPGDVGDRVDLERRERPDTDRGDQRGHQRHHQPVARDEVEQPRDHRVSALPPFNARNCKSASIASRRVSRIATVAST
jgi:hypothetical protein